MYELHYESSIMPLENIIQILEDGQLLYGHEVFHDIRDIIEEQNSFIENPPTLSESLYACKYCKEKKTFSTERQVRSCDEPMSIFVYCTVCKNNIKLVEHHYLFKIKKKKKCLTKKKKKI